MWKKITEERYNRQLDFMLPTAMTDWGFLSGEPEDTNAAHQPRYTAYVKADEQFFESIEPVTADEFHSLKIGDVR